MISRRWMVTAAAVALVSLGSTALAQGGVGGGGGGGGTGGGGGGGGATSTPSADLQLTGSAATNSPDPGSILTYTFQVKNTGGSIASSVVFSDPVPTGTTPVGATVVGATLPCPEIGDLLGGATFRCDLGSMAKGASASIQVSVTVPQVAAPITNIASVASATTDPKLTNNAVTLNSAVKAPTGGVCKGGVCDTVPSVQAAPCAVLTSVSAPVGYYSTFAAVWNSFTVQSCSSGNENISVQAVETNVATGSVDYDQTYATTLVPGQNLGIVLDNDFAPFNTTYDITYTVRDGLGNVLSTSTVRTTTPSPL